ncbi:MAG: phage tail sheath subtilisin-like domain-containing protein [Oscillospiraceae bacterium]|nr:phage tail sheath subtilisin-like domain-containing protein [Oscillospiraceae bacterium]
MSITAHERPGVYSSYDASAAVSGAAGSKYVGLAVRMSQSAQSVWQFTRYEQAVAAFGTGEAAQLVRLLLENGAAQVFVYPVEGEDKAAYQTAFDAMAAQEGLAVLVCDSTLVQVQQALRDSVSTASAAQRERIAVVAGAAGESVSELVERAQAINSERVVLTAPGCVDEQGTGGSGVQVAAAVAGVIAGQSDPAVPLGGAVLGGLYGLDGRYEDGELDALIRGGVTPVEELSGTVRVVRGVTTRTSTDGALDSTWRDLNSILVVDDVIPTVRNALKSRFSRAKNTAQTRGAIRSQVVLELENKLTREIITGYSGVSVQQDSEEPTRCLVDFSFTVTHGINQIWLSAHITI